jgi:hypothetical protein
MTVAAVGLLALATTARAQITIDATTAFNSSNSTFSGTFNASGSDKLVVIVTGEHGFNNDQGNCNSVTYDGVLLTRLIDRNPLASTTDTLYNDIWYLDKPAGSTGLLALNTTTRGNVTAYALSGTMPGAGATVIGAPNSRTANLTTTGANSLVIVSWGLGGAGNTAGLSGVGVNPPLTETSKQENGSNWDGHVTGYAFVANAGTGTYSFTGGNSSGAHVIAAEFLSEPSAHVTAPTVVNSGASNIQPTTATLGGEVTDTGNEDPVVILYWGDNDGGTNPGNWDTAIPFAAQDGSFSADISGLAPSTPYFFRCFASNSAGGTWAASTVNFTTVTPPNPPSVTNTPASNVSFTSADLNGTVTDTGGEDPSVIIYYGDNDGGTNPEAWAAAVSLGTRSGAFTTGPDESPAYLIHNTAYYFRAFAANSGGSAWAPSSASFTTLAFSLPAVTTTAATSITATAARINGQVTSTGNDPPEVMIYYGDNDGGTTIGNWDAALSFGVQSGDFSSFLSGLSPSTTYYFRARAENSAGAAWSGASLGFTTQSFSEVVINEFMAANDGGRTHNPNSWYPIANQMPGTSEDWIEILNTGASSIDLGGWHLSDDAGNLTKWTFPPGTVVAGGAYLIVYASGNASTDANGNLRTNFKLSADGEHLALVRPNLTIASAFGPGGSDYPVQSNDISYGLHPLTGEAAYFDAPTPGGANDPTGIARVAETTLSPERGYYPTAIEVTLATATDGATIYYTTDGAPPVDDLGNPTATATAYGAAVSLSKTTPVRAAAVKSGFAPSKIQTRTYVLLDIGGANADGTDPAGLNTPFIQQTKPANWGAGDVVMDVGVTQSTATAVGHATSTAQTLLLGMRDLPTISIVMKQADFSGASGIYSNAGNDTLEYGCSAEFIPMASDSRKDWQIDCGIAVFGGASRTSSPKHGLGLRFRSEYGPGKLRQPLFPGSKVEEFNSLALRAGYNNSWIHWDSNQRARGSMTRDQWMRQSMLDMGNPAAGEGFMVHLFVNGLYFGVHNLCERQEASHYAAHNGGDEDLLDARNTDASIVDGDAVAYDAMKAVIANTADPNYWSKVQGVLDVDQHIDYQIINRYAANADMNATKNWRAAGGGPFPPGQPELMAPWQLYSWDGERTLEEANSTRNPPDPMNLRNTLDDHPEYRMRFADRLQKHFFHGGALTPEACRARWKKYADALDRAIIAESARWGDHRRQPPYTRDVEWLDEQNRLYDTYFPVRSSNVFLGYDSMFPDTAAPVFLVNGGPQHGGEIPDGGTLAVTAAAGTIYYTLDGSDPRAEGGAVNPGAVAVSSGATISLSASGLVRMRARNGSEWSALDEATFYVEALAGPGDLVISEIHYHPYEAGALENAAGAALSIPRRFNNRDDFEFIELHNISGKTVNLDGVSFTSGISGTFGVHTVPAGGHVVVVKDSEAFAVRYPLLTPAGSYLGSLANDGEQLALVSSSGDTIVNLTYGDSGPWSGRADGNGSSLEMINFLASANDPGNWRPSSEFNGSPGAAGSGPDKRIVINEALTHSDLPEKDAIELHNTTGGTIDISGWILSDRNEFYPSFSIPPTSIPAGGDVTFDEDDFNLTPANAIAGYSGTPAAAPTEVNLPSHGLATGDTITIEGYGGIGAYNDTFQVTVVNADRVLIDTPFLDNHGTKGKWISGRPFALNASRGEDLWLLETDPAGRPVRFVDHVDFAAAFRGETLGRWPNGAGTGTLVSMTSNTLGSPNLGAQVGPVIISEVMYHPLGASGDLSEFVEICNAGSVSESLANWKLRGGADFDFTAGHLLAPGAVLVVVAFDPLTQPTQAAAFRAEYGIALGVPLVGPFTDGPLGNDTGTVRLQRPDSPPSEDPGYYPQVTEDEVIYLSEAPWSVDAAGNGQSLHRVGPDLFGNFASSWTGKPPTPGTGPFDYRNWAANHPGADLSDPAADLDGDGLSNDDERIWGLDPTSGSSNSPYVAMPDAIARTFSYTRRDPVVTGISYTVWTSPDLLTWSEDLGARQEQTSLLNEVETVQVTVSAAPVDGRLFVRVMAVD